MKRSQTRRSSANDRAAEPASAAKAETLLVWSSPEGPDRWLAAARAALLDLVAAAREGARRPRDRVLSRAEIRCQAHDAFRSAYALLDEAAVALRAAAPLVKPRSP
jgi:hypothetical protein